jgi:cationic peptide transport system ATP-binding protein
MLAGMVEPTAGEVLIDDHPLTFGDYSFRSQRIRMIFQDPSTSLNPPAYFADPGLSAAAEYQPGS